jgi:DNA-binding protein YbaB
MSAEDGRAALLELLAMAEELERGIDEVSARLQSTVDATHTGRSADRHVTVTVTGGGAVTGVRYDRNWLLEAHEINIGRQTLSAFTAAYESAARTGVGQLIAESSLGEVQRAAQDPFGLARRLRLHD